MRKLLQSGIRLPVIAAAFLLVAALVAVAVPSIAGRRGAEANNRAASAPRSGDATASGAAKNAVVTPKPATTSPAPAPVTKPAPAAEPKKAATPAKPSIDAYRGVGVWVDIYDGAAWKNPTAAVKDMKRHGVRTLYLETANFHSEAALYKPEAVAEFIRAAHARDMRVVAWYLPDMKSVAKDYDRSARAIRFRTPDGQKFDSFTLDIESGDTKPVSKRNRNLETLSHKIRKLAGPSYPLGACIPSPVGLAKKGSYWRPFPYAMLADTYDVFVPMSYYTYHGEGGAAAYADTYDNVRILRNQKGSANTPIHLIGGLADKSSASELRAFVRAGKNTRSVGVSMYGWPEMNAELWKELSVAGD